MTPEKLFPLLVGFAMVESILGVAMMVLWRNTAIGAALIAIGCSLIAVAVSVRKKSNHG